MKLEDLTTIDQLVEFLFGTQAVAFSFLATRTPLPLDSGELVKITYLPKKRQETVVPLLAEAE